MALGILLSIHEFYGNKVATNKMLIENCCIFKIILKGKDP